MKNTGWISLYRKITEWEWWDDHSTSRLFLWLLLESNHTEKKWRGVNIKRGEKLTSLDKMSLATGLTIQEVRTCIKKLKSTHEITSRATNNYTVITITNYDKYQATNTQDNKRTTNEQQTNNKRATTNNNDNNVKNVENKNIYPPEFEEFWINYPRQRRGSKKIAYKSYKKALLHDSHANILAGCLSYAVSDEVRKGYAKGAEGWLNDDRWLNDYTIKGNEKHDRIKQDLTDWVYNG